MRNAFRDAIATRGKASSSLVFLTGDLGFMALEPVRDSLGPRFINAGIAEQNMVGVAAGLARSGLEAWVYSIAPFVYARPFEQVRNDVCLHRLPVKLVANGGGYAYGAMGPTHHALEDYGVMSALPFMKCYVPAFDQDLEAVVSLVGDHPHPAYLRLGRGEPPPEWRSPAYAPWRQLCDGSGPVMVAVGPMAGLVLEAALRLNAKARPQVWAACEFPLQEAPPPPELVAALADRDVWVVEEHVRQGSAAQMILIWLAERDIKPRAFRHICALGYPSGRYGNQNWHRRECGLDADSLYTALLTGTSEFTPHA